MKALLTLKFYGMGSIFRKVVALFPVIDLGMYEREVGVASEPARYYLAFSFFTFPRPNHGEGLSFSLSLREVRSPDSAHYFDRRM